MIIRKRISLLHGLESLACIAKYLGTEVHMFMGCGFLSLNRKP